MALGADDYIPKPAEPRVVLLWLLARCAGTVLTRDDIKSRMRGIEHDGLDRSIDMRISRLRKRLCDTAQIPTRIKTVRTKGYLFSPTAWN
jgi:DNA-binding response OmpR family regulator